MTYYVTHHAPSIIWDRPSWQFGRKPKATKHTFYLAVRPGGPWVEEVYITDASSRGAWIASLCKEAMAGQFALEMETVVNKWGTKIQTVALAEAKSA